MLVNRAGFNPLENRGLGWGGRSFLPGALMEAIQRWSGCHHWRGARPGSTQWAWTTASEWLARKPPSRAGSLHRGLGIPVRDWSAGRPPSRASPLPQKSKGRAAYTHALHHSSGRALARLQLLILIHPPPRQAEWRRSSGGWARSAVRRSRTHREEVEAKPTGGDAPG
ncbi:hypothetical protein J2X87_002802 [Pseudomonas synxantha]|uniref:Uncharacterized protein n=1 Tax=Pseudomonas synxantha TaxID=47883 RepID=A0ACC6JMJ5_9PSED|nr:hypothetical protein [Pseudomonas synxantha]